MSFALTAACVCVVHVFSLSVHAASSIVLFLVQWVASIGAHSQAHNSKARVPHEIRKGVFCLPGRRKKPKTKKQLLLNFGRPNSPQEIWAPADDLLACKLVYNIANQ